MVWKYPFPSGGLVKYTNKQDLKFDLVYNKLYKKKKS